MSTRHIKAWSRSRENLSITLSEENLVSRVRRVPLRRRAVKEVNYTIDLIKITQSWAIMDKQTANQCYKEVLVCIKVLRGQVKSRDTEKKRIYWKLLKLELALCFQNHCITPTSTSRCRIKALLEGTRCSLLCSWSRATLLLLLKNKPSVRQKPGRNNTTTQSDVECI